MRELITRQDGQVCGAVLRVISRTGEPTIPCCPLQLLYPLEARDPGSGRGIIDTTQILLSKPKKSTRTIGLLEYRTSSE